MLLFRLATKSVPSAGHIIWLCINTHDELRRMCSSGMISTVDFKVPEPISESVRADTEFEVVLYDCFKWVPQTKETKECLDTLRMMRRIALENDAEKASGVSFSESMLSSIRGLIEIDQTTAMHLTELLTPRNSKPITVIVSPIHRLWLEWVHGLINDEKYSEVVQSLRWLSFKDETVLSHEDADLCFSVFTKIVEASDVVQCNPKVSKSEVFQSLLAAPSTGPLKWYHKIQTTFIVITDVFIKAIVRLRKII